MDYVGKIVYDGQGFNGRIIHDGKINYYNNSFLERWDVKSDCDAVHIISSVYWGTPFDVLTIDGIDYPRYTDVNQITSSNFDVYYSLDTRDLGAQPYSRFNLSWSCAEWGGWAQATDGTCNQERRPINNGENTIGRIKYRTTNFPCRK